MLTLLFSNDFILFWHFHKKICLKTFFEDKHFDPVNAFGPNTFQPCYREEFYLVSRQEIHRKFPLEKLKISMYSQPAFLTLNIKK